MKDPGFVPGFIGWVIGFFMAYIIRQINIVVSFPEQLKALKIHRGNYAKVLKENPTPPTDLDEWEELPRKISEMVNSGSAVLRFNFISRYWMCKKITSLIKDIEMHQSCLVLRIGVAAAHKRQTAVESAVNDEVPKHARSATEQKEGPEAAPSHAVSELDAQAVPTHAVSEVAVELEEVDTANRASLIRLQIPGNQNYMAMAKHVRLPNICEICNGFYSRFMEILEHINIDISGRKHLASLEDLAMEIGRSIPIKIKKERINCTSDDNGSVVEAWIEQLVEVLGRAYDMNRKYKDRFIYNPKARKRISGLTSEINTLLKLGQVNIILKCFNN